MTRGKLVLLINGKIYSSAEYNRNQHPDGLGAESYALISDVETLSDMEKACQQMNKYYKYPNGDTVCCIADKNENPDVYASLLDFAGNYEMLGSSYTQDVKLWLSNYLYIKNMEQKPVTIRVLTPRDEKGNSSAKEIQFASGSTLCLKFGHLLSEQAKEKLRWLASDIHLLLSKQAKEKLHSHASDIHMWQKNTDFASVAKARIEEYMRDWIGQYGGTVPIFEIMLIEHPDKELIYPKGIHSGFPDTGSVYTVGFYYTYDEAAEVLHENACDIRETKYDAAFLICRYPGLDNSVTSEGRVYFLWNTEKEGYVEAEEPKIFKHMAY